MSHCKLWWQRVGAYKLPCCVMIERSVCHRARDFRTYAGDLRTLHLQCILSEIFGIAVYSPSSAFIASMPFQKDALLGLESYSDLGNPRKSRPRVLIECPRDVFRIHHSLINDYRPAVLNLYLWILKVLRSYDQRSTWACDTFKYRVVSTVPEEWHEPRNLRYQACTKPHDMGMPECTIYATARRGVCSPA